MEDILFGVLKKIEDEGFSAYIVGGYVRDKILGINSKDADLTTSASPKDLMKIFPGFIKVIEEYGAVKLKLGEYIFDITTFRSEYEYENNKPKRIEYVKDLRTDLTRRDFTMNTVCINSSGEIIDYLEGVKDIKAHLIKVVGNTREKFNEDNTRILRALRFYTILDFELDESIIDYLKNNTYKIGQITINKRKEELDKIFTSFNTDKFISFIKKYKIEEALGIKINDDFVNTKSIVGAWAQIECTNEYNFTKIEKKQIEKIKALVKKGSINSFDIYMNGNYISLIASMILKIDTKKIDKLYTNLAIKGIIDINLNVEDICDILHIKQGKEIGKIYNILESEIISGKLNNEKEILKARVLLMAGEDYGKNKGINKS